MRPLMLCEVPQQQASPMTQVLWDSILGITDAPVLVLDTAGEILAANAPAKTLLDLPSTEGEATMLDSVLREAVAAEMLRYVRSADDSDSPLIVDIVLNGQWLRLTLRPCEFEQSRAVLIVGSHGHESQPVTSIRQIRATHDDLGQLESLTPRELEILRLIALGLSSNEIARVLYRSVKTIEGHRVSLRSKLQVTNRVELARIALQSGLITLDTPLPEIPAVGQEAAQA